MSPLAASSRSNAVPVCGAMPRRAASAWASAPRLSGGEPPALLSRGLEPVERA